MFNPSGLARSVGIQGAPHGFPDRGGAVFFLVNPSDLMDEAPLLLRKPSWRSSQKPELFNCHCEERSDEAIPNSQEEIASLRSQ